MHTISLMFAREAVVEPDLSQQPTLARALLFGPLTSVSFRFSGAGSLPEVAAQITAEARAIGTVVSPQFSTEEITRLQVLAPARKDQRFTDFVNLARSSELEEIKSMVQRLKCQGLTSASCRVLPRRSKLSKNETPRYIQTFAAHATLGAVLGFFGYA